LGLFKQRRNSNNAASAVDFYFRIANVTNGSARGVSNGFLRSIASLSKKFCEPKALASGQATSATNHLFG
jgi:hypothetical protein